MKDGERSLGVVGDGEGPHLTFEAPVTPSKTKTETVSYVLGLPRGFALFRSLEDAACGEDLNPWGCFDTIWAGRLETWGPSVESSGVMRAEHLYL